MTNRYNQQAHFVEPYQSEDERRLAEARPITAWSPSGAVVQVQPHEVEMAAPVVTKQTITTNAVDRAKAFNISTMGLSAITGIGGLLIAVVGWGVPLLSVSALAVLFLAAGAVWGLAWLWYAAASPDGIGLIKVLLQYRLLRHEQRARLDRIDRMMDGE